MLSIAYSKLLKLSFSYIKICKHHGYSMAGLLFFFFAPMLVCRSYEFSLVRPYVHSISHDWLIFFLKFGRMIEGNDAIRITEPNFQGNIWFAHKWGWHAPNSLKIDPFAIYSKCCYYFFLQMLLNDKAVC